jgi:hypothetical protein
MVNYFPSQIHSGTEILKPYSNQNDKENPSIKIKRIDRLKWVTLKKNQGVDMVVLFTFHTRPTQHIYIPT